MKPFRVSFIVVIGMIAQCFAVDLMQFLEKAKVEQSISPEQKSLPPYASVGAPPDNSIDPERYYIGPGDMFSVSVLDMPSISYAAVVNQRSDIYFPDFGVMILGKVTLDKATQEIASYVKKRMRGKHEIYVTLSGVKQVAVKVTGAIANPGAHTLSGSLGILEAIKIANNGMLPSFNDCDYREILLNSGDSIEKVDLFKFLFGGDDSSNRYLYSGDHITINLSTKRVDITGAICNTIRGSIPIKTDETLSDFLSMFQMDQSADSNAILLQRAGDKEPSKIQLSDASSTKLRDRDMIFVSIKANYPTMLNVSIVGEVARPGVYPIVKGKTSVEELLKLSGGTTDLASKKRIAVIRKSKGGSQPGNQSDISPIRSISSVRPEISSALLKLSLTSDYTVIPFEENGTDIFLEQDDQIVVPRVDHFVYISGNVRMPGAYPYKAGSRTKYYINQAGGYSRRADRSNVFAVRSYGSAFQLRDSHSIADGDILVIPEAVQVRILANLVLPIIVSVGATIISSLIVQQFTK